MSDSKTCSSCPARFGGEAAAKALSDHVESFHPAGAPVKRIVQTPADVRAVGRDFGPGISAIASDLADVKAALSEQGERLKALEDGRRSSTELDVLADQLTPRLGLGVVPPATPSEPTADASTGPTYRDLQARARELGLPATGKLEELQIAIAEEEKRLAEAALAARSGESDQGGDASPAGDPDA